MSAQAPDPDAIRPTLGAGASIAEGSRIPAARAPHHFEFPTVREMTAREAEEQRELVRFSLRPLVRNVHADRRAA